VLADPVCGLAAGVRAVPAALPPVAPVPLRGPVAPAPGFPVRRRFPYGHCGSRARLWSCGAVGGPVLVDAARTLGAAMTYPALVPYTDAAMGTGLREPGERDDWYTAHLYSPEHRATMRVRRTAHAAAVGRALLAYCLGKDTNTITAVVVFACDTDGDAWPSALPPGALADAPPHTALAVVTDETPVPEEVARVERAVEDALVAGWRWEAARAEALEQARAAHVALRGTAQDRTVDDLASMLDGVMPRPVALERPHAQGEAADTA
jgi:hypothetical protein